VVVKRKISFSSPFEGKAKEGGDALVERRVCANGVVDTDSFNTKEV
jgi:hypothetical protein